MERNGVINGTLRRCALAHAWLIGLAIWVATALADCARSWGVPWPLACGAAGRWLPPASGLRALGVAGLVLALLGGAWLSREARRTRAALRTSRAYLAMASHELRAPANGMLALIELLPRDTFSTEQRRLLAHARESGRALTRVLDDMLDYASIEAGQVTLRMTRVDVRDWLEGVLAPLGARARCKGIGFRWRVASEVPARIVTDGVRLRQILVNLLDNAIKYTARGSVSLVVGVREVARGAVTLVLTVDDTGSGIAGGEMARLFDPFARLGGAAARRTRGAGLGLPIARQLARALGGDVTVTNGARRGARAEAWIRCTIVGRRAAGVARVDVGDGDEGTSGAATEPGREPGRRASRPLDGASVDAVASRPGDIPLRWLPDPLPGRRILAVDDHPLNRLALGHQLDALGYASCLCDDGAMALAALEAAPFDAVLTDCLMPGMDGAALAAAIGAHPDPRVRATPVIGVTALAARDAVARCLAAGMVTCLDKPTPLAALANALAAVGARPGGFDPERLDTVALLDGIGGAPLRGAGRRAFLDTFAGTLEDDRATLERQLRDALPGDALRAWCHTARGTFGLFGQPHIDALLDELNRRLDGEPDALRAAVGDVLAMIRHLQRCVASAARERDTIVVSLEAKGE